MTWSTADVVEALWRLSAEMRAEDEESSRPLKRDEGPAHP